MVDGILEFDKMGEFGFFWTSSSVTYDPILWGLADANQLFSYLITLSYNQSDFPNSLNWHPSEVGLSVRCLKD